MSIEFTIIELQGNDVRKYSTTVHYDWGKRKQKKNPNEKIENRKRNIELEQNIIA